MPVEELDVAVQVLVEVPTGTERPRERSYGVDREPQGEQDERSERSAGEPLEPGEGTREPVSSATQT
jgi:hypothetical protein